MNLTTLYEIAPALHDALTAEEFDEAAFDALVVAFEDKAKAIIHLSQSLDGFAEMARAEEKRIAEKRRAAEARNERIMAYLKRCMEVAEIAELPLGTMTAKIQTNPPKVVIDDEMLIPGDYVKIVQEKQIDKKLIAEAIKAGEKVDGAHLEQGTTLRIK